MAVAEEEPQVEGLPPGATLEPLAPVASPLPKGLPPGATIEPLERVAAPKPSAPPPDATLQPLAGSSKPPAPTANDMRAQGQVEGWLPPARHAQPGNNPVFRPGSPPALYQSANPPKPEAAGSYAQPPQQAADMPPASEAPPPVPRPKPIEMRPLSVGQALTGDVSGLPQALSEAKQAVSQAPGVAQKPETPILPKLEQLDEWALRKVGAGPQLERNKAILLAYEANHPYQAKVREGIDEFLNGQSTPSGIALLATAPESKLISAFFAAQAAHGTYKSANEAYQAHLRGDNPEAVKLATEAGLTGLLSLAAAWPCG